MSAAPTRATALGLAAVLAVAAAGCGRGKKEDSLAAGLLSAGDAYSQGMEHLSRGRLRQAISTLQRIQYTPEAVEEVEPLSRLAIADATFYQRTDLSLIDARSLYLDFVTLYGDHKQAAYAQTQAGLCSLGQVNHPSRDQSQTHQALDDLDEVVRRFPASPFAEVARGLRRKARSNLAESEYLVGRFYMKRKKYLAATERFNRVLSEYPDFTETEKVLYYIGRTLHLLDNDAKGRIYLGQLVEDYPDSAYAATAAKLLAELASAPEREVEAAPN